MATGIRNKFVKSTAFKIILWFTLLSLAGVFSLTEVIRFAFSRPTWVVSVNGHVRYLADLTRKINYQELLVQSVRQQYGEYADMFLQMMGMAGSPEDRALDQLTGEALFNEAAQKLSLAIPPTYSNAKLLDPSFVYRHADIIPPYAIDATGSLDSRRLNAYLQQMNLSLADLQQEIVMSIKRDFLVNSAADSSSLVELSVYTPTFAIKDQYHQEHTAKKFSVLTFNLDTFLKKAKNEPIGDNELQIFFDEQVAQKNYWVPEKRSGIMWRFEPSNYGIAVSQGDIEAYYNAHKTKDFIESPSQLEIKKIVINRSQEKDAQSALDTIEDIHNKLVQDPSQFSTLAQNMSEDKGTASMGGLMEPFSRGTHDRELEKAAFSLAQDGDISPVIATEDAFIIIQRISKTAQKFKPLSSVEQSIRNTLMQEKFNKTFIADMKNNAELFGQHKEQATSFFKNKRAKEEKIDHATKDSSRAAQALFAETKGSYNFYLDGDIGVVVLLTDIVKRYLPSLDAIRSTVEKDLYRQRAFFLLEKAVAQARSDAQTNSFEELSKVKGVDLEVIDFVSAQDNTTIKELGQRGIPIKEMMQIEKPYFFISHLNEQKGFLARLDEIKPFDDQGFAAEYDAVESKVKQEVTQHVIAGFVASLYRNATIKTNESVINV